jgi:hypothetical protein
MPGIGNREPKPKPTYCRVCGTECLENKKTIKGQVIIWCQECEQQWLKGDDEKVSSRLLESEAKAKLELRAEQIKSWGELMRNVNDPAFWDGDD